MSGEFDILSVAEDGGRLDRLTGKAAIGNGNLFLSVDENSNVAIRLVYYEHKRTRAGATEVTLEKVDMNHLLHFLKEAKQFIDEQEVMNRLMGK
jgi:hypothetical protein